jgi:phosphate transport system protein
VTRVGYQEELERLQQGVVEELDVVLEQLALVLEALERSDREVAGEVMQRDEEVDRRYARLQNDLVTVIARQAPVASDLRLITALLHITRMVERMGDQCVNIAKLVPVGGAPPPGAESLHACLLELGRTVEQAVRDVAQALREHDRPAARALAERDAAANDLNRACFTSAIELGDTEERRAWATAMILVARAFERIGDNAVDIGAHLNFAVTGRFEARDAA